MSYELEITVRVPMQPANLTAYVARLEQELELWTEKPRKDVHFSTRMVEVLDANHQAVQVSPDPDEVGQYTVAGDLFELLEGATLDQLAAYEFAHGQESPNHAVVAWAQREFPNVALDPEYSCFFGYTTNRGTADRFAAALNAREWMVPA